MTEHDADAVRQRMLDALEALWERDDDATLGEIVSTVITAIQPGDRLPGGLVVVPEEPTEAMLRALNEMAQCEGFVPEGYRDMIAAASGDT